jgi:hypothetical protein
VAKCICLELTNLLTWSSVRLFNYVRWSKFSVSHNVWWQAESAYLSDFLFCGKTFITNNMYVIRFWKQVSIILQQLSSVKGLKGRNTCETKFQMYTKHLNGVSWLTNSMWRVFLVKLIVALVVKSFTYSYKTPIYYPPSHTFHKICFKLSSQLRPGLKTDFFLQDFKIISVRLWKSWLCNLCIVSLPFSFIQIFSIHLSYVYFTYHVFNITKSIPGPATPMKNI